MLAVQGGNLPGILTRNRRVRDARGPRRTAAARTGRAAAGAATLRRRSGGNADGRGVLRAGEGRARRRGRAEGHAEVPAFRRGGALLQHARAFRAAPMPPARWANGAGGRSSDDAARDPRAKAWRSGSTRSNRELHAAEIAGEALGTRARRRSTPTPSPADVARFLEGIRPLRRAQRAARCSRFGIDGLTTFRHARDAGAHQRAARQDRLQWRGNMSGAAGRDSASSISAM